MTKTIIGAYHHYAFQPDDPAMATVDDDVWFFCLAAAGGVAYLLTSGASHPGLGLLIIGLRASMSLPCSARW